MEPVRETAHTRQGTEGAFVWAPGCKPYQRARSEPRPPPRKMEREGQAASEMLPQLW